MTIVIGFGHVARAGKSTAAQALCRDLQFKEVSFAAPLKALALLADPLVVTRPGTVNTNAGRGRLAWEVQGLGGFEQAKDIYPEVRLFLENLGAGCRKVFGESIFVDAALRLTAHEDRIVVPDVRHVNEAEAIQKAGGFVFKVNRPGHTPSASRPSELALIDWDGWDGEFENTGGVIELQQAVVERVKALLK